MPDAADGFQILGRIDSDARCIMADMHRNAMPMPQCPQLLQRLAGFERSWRQMGKGLQKVHPVAVDADVPQRGRSRRWRP